MNNRQKIQCKKEIFSIWIYHVGLVVINPSINEKMK